MNFIEYVKPEFLIITPVLYVIGILLKNNKVVKDNMIPLILSGISILLSLTYVLSISELDGFRSVMEAVFTSLTQGFLIAGAAVLCNQIKKQNDKKDD